MHVSPLETSFNMCAEFEPRSLLPAKGPVPGFYVFHPFEQLYCSFSIVPTIHVNVLPFPLHFVNNIVFYILLILNCSSVDSRSSVVQATSERNSLHLPLKS